MKKRNILRRFGSHCAECGKKLGEYRIDGAVNGEFVGFCCFKCCDTYQDKQTEPAVVPDHEDGDEHCDMCL